MTVVIANKANNITEMKIENTSSSIRPVELLATFDSVTFLRISDCIYPIKRARMYLFNRKRKHSEMLIKTVISTHENKTLL